MTREKNTSPLVYQSTRPTRAEIDIDALRHNFRLTRKLASGVKLMAVVKAEAYGHGLVKIAREFTNLGTDYLAVSFLEEGILLRESGIDIPILVLGGFADEQIEQYLDYNLDITVSSVYKAKLVNSIGERNKRNCRIHLKTDTGMGRIGQNWQTAGLLFRELSNLNRLEIAGLYTHFATADEPDLSFARVQLQRFCDVLEVCNRHKIEPEHIHAANSGAILQLGKEALFDLVRPGIMLYGQAPSPHLCGKFDLNPVMTLKTVVVYVKKPGEGITIGYGSTYSTPGGKWIATLPLGYGDGIPLPAGNSASVLLRGCNCPIVGRVSMDQITIDAGDEVYLGDEVIIFGKNGEETVSLWDFACASKTIAYDVMCGLTTRVPRIYFKS